MTIPALDRPWLLASALGYLALMLAIGVWSLRRTQSARDFYIAGQRLGVVVTGIATMSAAFSGFVFVGGPGLTYRIGLASLWIVVPVGFTATMFCWVLGKRLRLLAGAREVFTVPDAVQARYGSRLAAGLTAAAVAIGAVGYLGAQLLALGRALEAVLGTRELLGKYGLDEYSLAVAMAVGLAVVLAYSVAGGMLATVWTELVQGPLMVVAAAAVFAGAMAAGGGWGRIVGSIAGSERFGPEFLDPLGTLPPLTAFGFVFVFGVGVLGQPHMLHKLFMLRDPARLRWLPLVLGGSQSVCLLLWLGVGLAVPALVAQGRMAPLANPDDATPAFVLGFLPGALAGLVFAAILAAIMSTADSFLNLGAAALARDLPRALGLRQKSGPFRNELAAGRAATVVFALAAGVFAWIYDDLIALLGTFAFGTFAAALTPALAVGLNWKRVPAAAASASIATGLVLNLGLELLARQTAFPALRPPLAAGVLPSAVALAGSFTVLFAVTGWHVLRRRPAPPLAADVAAVMDA